MERNKTTEGTRYIIISSVSRTHYCLLTPRHHLTRALLGRCLGYDTALVLYSLFNGPRNVKIGNLAVPTCD